MEGRKGPQLTVKAAREEIHRTKHDTQRNRPEENRTSLEIKSNTKLLTQCQTITTDGTTELKGS